MKEITRVHIANVAYSIELDAKRELQKYLEDIAKNLKTTDDEIQEIEIRITEILASRDVLKDGIISLKDVDFVKLKLGNPSDFKEEADAEEDSYSNKKLMRDVQNGLFSGVIAGFANYCGINVWFARAIAIILTFVTSGVFAIVYLVFIFILPKADSVSLRLESSGKYPDAKRIKNYSAAMKNTDKGLVIAKKITRIALGILLMCISAGLLFGIVAIIILSLSGYLTRGIETFLLDGNPITNDIDILATFLISIAGISIVPLLFVSLILTVYSFKGKKKDFVKNLIISVIGVLISCLISGVGFFVQYEFFNKVSVIKNQNMEYFTEVIEVDKSKISDQYNSEVYSYDDALNGVYFNENSSFVGILGDGYSNVSYDFSDNYGVDGDSSNKILVYVGYNKALAKEKPVVKYEYQDGRLLVGLDNLKCSEGVDMSNYETSLKACGKIRVSIIVPEKLQ